MLAFGNVCKHRHEHEKQKTKEEKKFMGLQIWTACTTDH